MTDECLDPVPFQAHVELLRLFLARRAAIVERIEALLNAQRRPIQYLHDRALLSRLFEDCFFTLAEVTDEQFRLRGRLEEAHWTSGFRPRAVTGLHNDLIDPAEMIVRGFYCWQQTRWPGRNGRVRYAHTLFNLYLLRSLMLLSMRLWDGRSDAAGERLAEIQDLLDTLWRDAPTDQPVLVRDARWLIPLAQSPTTDDLAAYFEVAERVAESLAREDRIEIEKAHVRMLGGHLTSQIRHYCMNEGVSIHDNSVVLRTRTSNALDFALLIQGLAGLLEAYQHARDSGDEATRLELAGAICQGISPDPEMFLNRIDLLGAYSMIEHLFVATDGDGQVDYTHMGRRHIRLLDAYEALMTRSLEALQRDYPSFRPVDGTCSPYGVIFGTPTHLMEHMALRTLQPDAVTTMSLEDVFVDADTGPDKLAWVNGWRQLPHIDREMQVRHAYPQQFAEEIFDRIAAEFSKRLPGSDSADASSERVPADHPSHASRTGRLFVLTGDDRQADSNLSQTADLPIRYIGSSDDKIVTAGQAESYDQSRLLRDRQEGYFVVSYETSGGWVAIRKDFLTEVLGAGQDVKIAGLPREAARTLSLMCPRLVMPDGDAPSVPPGAVRPTRDR